MKRGSGLQLGEPGAQPDTLLNGVTAFGIVEANHYARTGVVGVAVYPKVTVGVIDISDYAFDRFNTFLEKDIAGDDISVAGAVGMNRGDAAHFARVTDVRFREAAFSSAQTFLWRLGECLLERQPVGREVYEQIARDDDVLATDNYGAARPYVIRVSKGETLDLSCDGGRSRCLRVAVPAGATNNAHNAISTAMLPRSEFKCFLGIREIISQCFLRGITFMILLLFFRLG